MSGAAASTFPARRWVLGPPGPNALLTGLVAGGVDPVIAQILCNRGLLDADACSDFLARGGGRLGDPREMLGTERALERLARAVTTGETIGVYGDFDVDGITGTAVLIETLRHLGATAIPYLPNRYVDGYGLNTPGIDVLAGRGATLLVAVDCGVSATEAVAHATAHGLDTIVIDHHVPPETLPGATAIVNPRQAGCAYPFKDLAAVGVAFRLCQQLLAALPDRARDAAALEERLLELVTIGTVADIVPLLGENRVLLLRGLPVLARSRRPGVAAIVRRAAPRSGVLDADALGYSVIPRLNAPGRVGDPMASLRALLTDDAAEAERLADELEAANRERQRLTEAALAAARAQVERQRADGGLDALVYVASPDFSLGVIGLIAARIAEEVQRPAVVVSVGEVSSRGSIRSPNDLDAVRLLAGVGAPLTRFGGHARAGGFESPTAALPELRARLGAAAAQELSELDPRPSLAVDAELRLRAMDEGFVRRLAVLGPFGYGNPTPVFVSRGLRVVSARGVGKDGPSHLKLRLHDGAREREAIGFGLGGALGQIGALRDRSIDVAYNLEVHEWNGARTLQLRIRDWQPSESGA